MKSNTQNAKIEAITEKTLVLGIDVGSETHYARAFDYRGGVCNGEKAFACGYPVYGGRDIVYGSGLYGHAVFAPSLRTCGSGPGAGNRHHRKVRLLLQAGAERAVSGEDGEVEHPHEG